MALLIVYSCVPRSQAPARPLPVKWIDTNKGGDLKPNIRSRLVPAETRALSQVSEADVATCFAATPPWDALRSLLTTVAAKRRAGWVIQRLDVKRARLHAPTRRHLVIELPREDPRNIEGIVGFLHKTIYGCKDAGAAFDEAMGDLLATIGLKEGVHCPCVACGAVVADAFERATEHGLAREAGRTVRKGSVAADMGPSAQGGEMDQPGFVSLFRHGNDLAVGGQAGAVEACSLVLEAGMMIQPRGLLPKDGEAVLLNRLTTSTPNGFELEADPGTSS